MSSKPPPLDPAVISDQRFLELSVAWLPQERVELRRRVGKLAHEGHALSHTQRGCCSSMTFCFRSLEGQTALIQTPLLFKPRGGR